MNASEEAMIEMLAKLLGMSVTQLRMQMAVPDSLMRDVVRDNVNRPNPVTSGPSGMIPQKDRGPPVRGTGWIEPRPLEPPPGIALMDQMMDQQDRIDRADRIIDLAKDVAMKEATKKGAGNG